MHKIAIIGAGRVGLPFALSLIEAGLETTAVDKDPQIRKCINEEGRMPFHEPGYEDLAASKRLTIYEHLADVADCDYFVITVGTPLAANLEADLDNIVAVTRALCPLLSPGKTIICRSTVAPRVSDYLARLIEAQTGLRRDVDFFYAFCPERLLEGSAKADLATLPQIIGAESAASHAAARWLFQHLDVDIVECDCKTAELAKLILNSSRYVEFAISNYFSMMIATHGLDPLHVLNVANYRYPRPVASKPGFSAGTCLRKDYGLLVEGQLEGQFLVSAWQVNEGIPAFLIRRAIELWGPLSQYRVTVLGLAFKRDSDDVRDSLALKLVRLLERETPKALLLTDPMLSSCPRELSGAVEFHTSYKDAVSSADVVFLATNHSEFSREREEILEIMRIGNARLIDIWDGLGTGRMFQDCAAIRSGSVSILQNAGV